MEDQLELFNAKEFVGTQKDLKTLTIQHKKLPKRMFGCHLKLAVDLYQLFQGNYSEYEGTLSRVQAKRKKPHRLIRNLGIIAETSGEDDFALDLYARIGGQHYFKYLLWKKLNGTPEELAQCLEGEELDTIIGKLVKLKDFQTANILRKKLRDKARRENRYYEAARISYQMHDLRGLLHDVESTGQYDLDKKDLIKYARVVRSRSREISDRIFSLLENLALEQRRWGLVGLARAGKGDKQGALKAYEKAKKFSQATNLRINLNLPSKETARKSLEQKFHLERLKMLSRGEYHDPFFNTAEPMLTDLGGGYSLGRVMNLAKRYRLNSELEEFLLQRGMYLALRDINKSGYIELSADYNESASQIEIAQNVLRQLAKHSSSSKAALTDREKEMSDFRESLRSRGLNPECVNYLTLFQVYHFPIEISQEGSYYDFDHLVVPFLGQVGLKAISNIFQRKQYSLLVECTPKLIVERNEFETDENSWYKEALNSAFKKMPDEKARQIEVAKILKTAGARQRRRYAELGLNPDRGLDNLYGLNNGEVIIKRLGYMNF